MFITLFRFVQHDRKKILTRREKEAGKKRRKGVPPHTHTPMHMYEEGRGKSAIKWTKRFCASGYPELVLSVLADCC